MITVRQVSSTHGGVQIFGKNALRPYDTPLGRLVHVAEFAKCACDTYIYSELSTSTLSLQLLAYVTLKL